MSALAPNACGVATWNPPASRLDGVPGVGIDSRIATLLSAIGVPQLRRFFGHRALLDAIQDPTVGAICCHYTNLATSLRKVWSRTDKPLLVHAHGYDVTWDFRLPRRPHLRVFSDRYVEKVRQLSQRAILLANSEFTADRILAAGVPPDRVIVKYLGVPVPLQCPERPQREEVQILFLGRLVNFKGPEQTLRAFDLACRNGLRGKLVMAGDGPLRDSCERIRRESPFADRIELLGSIDAATGDRLRRESSIFTAHNQKCGITNQEEAYGVSVVEAMASGLPVVTGGNGGVRETVLDQETGLLFPTGDVAAHANGLLQLSTDSDRRNRLGKSGFQRAKRLFSLQAEQASWSAILKRIGVGPDLFNLI